MIFLLFSKTLQKAAFHFFDISDKKYLRHFSALEKKYNQCRFPFPFQSYFSIHLFFIFIILFFFLSFEILFFSLFYFGNQKNEILLFGTKIIFIITTFLLLLALISLFLYPYFYAQNRKIKIENQLPFAVNYIYAMAVAGVSFEEICKTFSGLKTKNVYDAVSEEFSEGMRQNLLIGKNTQNILIFLIDTTPSPLMKSYLSGAKNTLHSGSSFQKYTEIKKRDYQNAYKREKEKEMQSLDLLSEVYITVFLAAPIFFIILLYATIPFSGVKTNEAELITYSIVPFLGAVFLLISDISDHAHSH